MERVYVLTGETLGKVECLLVSEDFNKILDKAEEVLEYGIHNFSELKNKLDETCENVYVGSNHTYSLYIYVSDFE